MLFVPKGAWSGALFALSFSLDCVSVRSEWSRLLTDYCWTHFCSEVPQNWSQNWWSGHPSQPADIGMGPRVVSGPWLALTAISIYLHSLPNFCIFWGH